MSTNLQETLIRNASFEYWLHNGSERGKGELQTFIDKLPAIINTILQGGKLTLTDETIIYDAMFAVDDINFMSRNWPARMSLLHKHLTPEQISQAERNKEAVEALNEQVTHLLQELQNACATGSLSWATFKQSVISNVNQSRRTPRAKRRVRGTRGTRDLQMLLLQLKEVASL
jgi:polyhydroxyalkanoate synthesis regulator phasin